MIEVDKQDRWRFWIDRGGTFTDCLGVDPKTGRIQSAKVLSSDEAPLLAIRSLLHLEDKEPIPPCDVRMGTTVATNALLERKGAKTALVITEGFADALEIGTQARPDLFAFEIEKNPPLTTAVVETAARQDSQGVPLRQPDLSALLRRFQELRTQQSVESVAVVVLFAHVDGSLEEQIRACAERAGIQHVSLSSRVAPEIGLVARGDTTVADAYLTPRLKQYLQHLQSELPGSTLRVMQSSGGLTLASRFTGRNSVLSGPAGGVVAFSQVAQSAGFAQAIGFDMGGTSTDVSCFDGHFVRRYENEVAGVRLRAPMMAIDTVAAGGGSLCLFEGNKLIVGPRSAGSKPGPLCYGAPEARHLTVTDINLHLGRVAADRFPFALDKGRVARALERLQEQLLQAGYAQTPDEIAAGFFDIANANMAEAIRQVTVMHGKDPRTYALVVFGGAGGQHACALARRLGIQTLLFHRLGGVLSALGMGLAPVSHNGSKDTAARVLNDESMANFERKFQALERDGERALEAEGYAPASIRHTRRFDARYQGTDQALTVEAAESALSLRRTFETVHKELFGFVRPGVAVEIAAVRVESTGPALARLETPDASSSQRSPNPTAAPQPRQPNEAAEQATPRPPQALRQQLLWTGSRFARAPVYAREDLSVGTKLQGPALVLDKTGTLALDPGFSLVVASDDLIRVDAQSGVAEQTSRPKPNAKSTAQSQDSAPARRSPVSADTPGTVDPVRLEIYNNRFSSIAKQMGETLKRTAVSTNIRERLDFSCAVFDRSGQLVANAPHIPVHLGAMSESVRAVLSAHPHARPGTVFATNDPAAGGSHLPDITVVSPLHDARGALQFVVASRGHHADVGGLEPGSMPPFSQSLRDEGVVLNALPIVRDGTFLEADVLRALRQGPHPARNPHDNVANLLAQIAANNKGRTELERLVLQQGQAEVSQYMHHVQRNAEQQVRAALTQLPKGVFPFEDAMDDGARIKVTLTVASASLRVDFSGTSAAQQSSNLNAPRAVTVAALLYVLRGLVGRAIPLNAGCLAPVELIIPEGSLLSPPRGAAVVAGNVETSQRVVDVLLGALGRAAASQGTMNNLTFGNESFGYYETIAGGAGATPHAHGASGVHTHMTNTRITDPEVLESRYPMRLLRFALRPASGGQGQHHGGDGIIRTFEALAPMRVSIVSERRSRAPFGLAGGTSGQRGQNFHNGRPLAAKASITLQPGDTLELHTPGGGGWGRKGSNR